jgi:hypothetical protein
MEPMEPQDTLYINLDEFEVGELVDELLLTYYHLVEEPEEVSPSVDCNYTLGD